MDGRSHFQSPFTPRPPAARRTTTPLPIATTIKASSRRRASTITTCNPAQSTLLKQQEVLGGYDPSQYASERLWATARDGVKVPISIVYRKGFARDGRAPLFLYAYGSYGYGIAGDIFQQPSQPARSRHGVCHRAHSRRRRNGRKVARRRHADEEAEYLLPTSSTAPNT